MQNKRDKGHDLLAREKTPRAVSGATAERFEARTVFQMAVFQKSLRIELNWARPPNGVIKV